jgi:hypothetical protein
LLNWGFLPHPFPLREANNTFDDAGDHRVVGDQHPKHKEADEIGSDPFTPHYYDIHLHNHIPIVYDDERKQSDKRTQISVEVKVDVCRV